MRNIHLFSLSVVMLLRIRGSEARHHWKHDGGWFYTDKDVCQKERCDPWYGVFKEKGTEDDYKSATTAKIIGFKCFCTPSKELKKTIKRVYKGKFKAYAFRGLHFLGLGRKIRGWYPKIQFLGGYGNGGYSKVEIHHHPH